MKLDPLAKYYNTPEQYQRLKNFVDAHNRIEFDIDEKELDREWKKVKEKIDKSVAKVFK